MRHKSNNKTRPLFTLSLEMTRLVNETRLLLVPCFNSDIYGRYITLCMEIYSLYRGSMWSHHQHCLSQYLSASLYSVGYRYSACIWRYSL